MGRSPQARVARWMSAGAWSVRHWRGLLLSIWAAIFGVFALLAWWGYANRDGALGGFAMTVFGLIAVAMVLRFPKSLVRSMWATRGGRGVPPAPSDGIIDAESVARPRPSRPLPPTHPDRR